MHHRPELVHKKAMGIVARQNYYPNQTDQQGHLQFLLNCWMKEIFFVFPLT